MCVYTRVNLSMWGWSGKSWRPMLQCTSLQGAPLICPPSSETTACWLRNTSYDFSAEPRSDKSSSPNKATKSAIITETWIVAPYRSLSLHAYSACPALFIVYDGSSLRCKILCPPSAASRSGVCRSWVPLWGSSSHWGDSSGLCVPSATIWTPTLVRQQSLLRGQAHHKTGR